MKHAARIAEIVAPMFARGGFTTTTTVDSVEPYAATVEIVDSSAGVVPTVVVFVRTGAVVRAFLSGEPTLTGDESVWFSVPIDADPQTVREIVASVLF